MTLEDADAFLRAVEDNWEKDYDPVREALRAEKARAVARDDEVLAKKIWCLEAIARVQDQYISAFLDMKHGHFYDGWCKLERVEISISNLRPHFQESEDAYRLCFVEEQTSRFQDLFPYAIFLSPGMVYKEKVCSVCRARASIRNACGHLVGEIYRGEMCCREITKVEIMEISLVTEPAQKYSVAFPGGMGSGPADDPFNYLAVGFVVERLRSPFHGWSAELTQCLHPHDRFSGIGGLDACPCGSGRKYKTCCLHKSGVLLPHYQIDFDVPPPSALPTLVYTSGRGHEPRSVPRLFARS